MSAWNEQSVMVTGGTGSFGRAFLRRVLETHRPRRLIVFSRDELKQHELSQEFAEHAETMRYFLGDVRDRDRLTRAMRGVDLVVHAAALKQVPACEYNPLEAVKTNIDGSSNIVDAAIDAGVPKVLALSTDKAVNPVNLYGATKLVSEKIFVQGNAYSGESGTRFACVRYGNVIGSRGSVIPLFAQQRATGTVTLTDDRMTRFWITLDQGIDFVLNSIERMRGGEVFVPKIPSMKMLELARLMAPEAEVKVIGIRPGEKLHEMLVSRDESRHTLEDDSSYLIQPVHPWWGGAANAASLKAMPDGMEYSSETNDRWLSEADLRELAADYL